MLNVNINQDVEKYKEGVIGSFNVRQSICIFVAGIVGIGTICIMFFVLGINILVASYISLLLLIPIFLIGFGNKDGNTIFKKIKNFIEMKNKPLLKDSIYIHYDEMQNEEEKKGFLNVKKEK